MKDIKSKLWFRILQASFGLALFGFGVFITLHAGIGLSPWDVFGMGIVNHFPITFGQASIIISVIVVIIDILLREKIGLGTLLDAIIVGVVLDLYAMVDFIPYADNIWIGMIVMVIGLSIMALSQYFYMAAALCCGPRDTLLVGIGRRMPKVPIGAVLIGIEIIVTLVGWLLGGPAGIGTLFSAFGTGAIMQLIFRIIKFEPRDVVHEGIQFSKAKETQA